MRHSSIRHRWLIPPLPIFFAALASAGEAIDLSPAPLSEATSHVSIDLQVGGELIVQPENPKDAETERLPLSVQASIEYDERKLAAVPAGLRASGEAPKFSAVRYYHQAEAVIKIDNGGHTPTLREDRRLIVVGAATSGQTVFSCPDGRLERRELDLVNVIGNSLVLDELLPEAMVTEGEHWQNDQHTIIALLGLDSAAVCEVQSILDKANNKYAQIRMAGAVHGTIDGAITELDLRGIYLFDRRLRRATHLNLAVKESRKPGDVTPGLDVVAKLKVATEPLEQSSELSHVVAAELQSGRRLLSDELQHIAVRQGFQIVHDRRWFVTGEEREAVTLRRVEDERLIAHCTIRRLPPTVVDRPTSLEQFQTDIQFSLGKTFGEFVRSREWTNKHGLRCYEVAARGKVEEVPVQWHYFLLSSTDGSRASLTVTMEAGMVERLAHADRNLVDQLALVDPVEEPETESAATATETDETKKSVRSARLIHSPDRHRRSSRRPRQSGYRRR